MANEPFKVSAVSMVSSEARIVASAVGTREDLKRIVRAGRKISDPLQDRNAAAGCGAGGFRRVEAWIGARKNRADGLTWRTFQRAASALMPTPGLRTRRCREESRHGTHECVRHISQQHIRDDRDRREVFSRRKYPRVRRIRSPGAAPGLLAHHFLAADAGADNLLSARSWSTCARRSRADFRWRARPLHPRSRR